MAALLNRLTAILAGLVPLMAPAGRLRNGPLSEVAPGSTLLYVLPTRALLYCPAKPSFTPRLRLKVSVASTIRASMITWRTGMSILPMKFCTSSSLVAISETKSWLVRASAVSEPRLDSMRALAPADPAVLTAATAPPPAPMPSSILRTSSARW